MGIDISTVKLPERTPTEMIDKIFGDMCRHQVRARKQTISHIESELEHTDLTPDQVAKAKATLLQERSMESKARQAFKDRFGYSMLEPERVVPFDLSGPPGHGKTAAFRLAAKAFASAMGLRFLVDPPADYVPRPTDFLVVTYQAAGESSPIVWGGVPDAVTITGRDGTTVRAMDKLVDSRIVKMSMAGASQFLLDDFGNAIDAIKDAAMGIALEGVFNHCDLRNSYVGFTSNLGVLDGSNATPSTKPSMSRKQTFLVRDRLEDFVHRAKARYSDSFGDGLVTDFLDTPAGRPYFDNLNPNESNGVTEPFACPRTWDAMIVRSREALHALSNSGSDNSNLQRIHSELLDDAKAIIGEQAAQAYCEHFLTVLSAARPWAMKALDPKGLTDEQMSELRTLARISSPVPDRSFQLGYARAIIAEVIPRLSADGFATNDAAVADLFRRMTYALVATKAVGAAESAMAYSNWTISLANANPELMPMSLTESTVLKMDKLREFVTIVADIAQKHDVTEKFVADGVLRALAGTTNLDRVADALEPMARLRAARQEAQPPSGGESQEAPPARRRAVKSAAQ